jgi:hypothetical protein
LSPASDVATTLDICPRSAPASSAANPTESYAPGKSHEISRCTPCPASVPREDDTKCYARTPQYAPTPPHYWPHVRRALLGWFEPRVKGC